MAGQPLAEIAKQTMDDRESMDHGLSLGELGRAFAETLLAGDDPYHAVPSDAAADHPLPQIIESLRVGAAADAESAEVTPKSIVEAILFVGAPNNRPISAEQISKLMRGVRPAEIDELVAELNLQYAADECPYSIVSSGDGYQMQLREQFAPLRDRMNQRTRQARLSQAAVEVLSIVAYRGPLPADEVSRLRGSPSHHVLSQLVRRQLLAVERVAGRRKGQYRVTDRFLKLFGLTAVDELPRGPHAEP
ncbi:MAG TPA: SMC-Scp complex subunit ScpB [Pirellulales bacterium]|nr:SMC-Scp complex subunit ScpB [Pirellulales bacterium]